MVRALASAGCVAADEEAVELLATAPDDAALDALVARRTSGEPIAWITGATTFCGVEVAVDPGVYVPRWQSETLARRAADLLPDGGTAVDLCHRVGSGGPGAPRAAPLGPGGRHRDRGPGRGLCPLATGWTSGRATSTTRCPTRWPEPSTCWSPCSPTYPGGAFHLLPRDVLAFEPLAALDGGTDGLDVVREVVARQYPVDPTRRLAAARGGRRPDRRRR